MGAGVSANPFSNLPKPPQNTPENRNPYPCPIIAAPGHPAEPISSPWIPTILIEPHARQLLRQAFLRAKQQTGPFHVDALCLLPDHLHCIWTLPEDNCDYATRWKVIKACFSRAYRKQGGLPGTVSASMTQKGELGIWQRRYWEHRIRSRDDLSRHLDTIHFNPVKHGLAPSPGAWPWSTFHQYVREGLYPPDWGSAPTDITGLE